MLGPKKWGESFAPPLGHCWSCHPFSGQPPTQPHPQPQGQEVGPELGDGVRSFLAPHCCFHYSVTFLQKSYCIYLCHPLPPSLVVSTDLAFHLLKPFGIPPPSAPWVTLKSQPLRSTAFTCLITFSSARTLVHILYIVITCKCSHFPL